MKYQITKDEKGGEAWLTNENSASHYGIPNLEITGEDVSGVFGPADIIGEPPRLITGAQIVVGWAAQAERTDDEREAARSFCAQYPEGPQIA